MYIIIKNYNCNNLVNNDFLIYFIVKTDKNLDRLYIHNFLNVTNA